MEEGSDTIHDNKQVRLFMIKSFTMCSIVIGFMKLVLWLLGAKMTFILINGILILAYVGYIIRGVNQLFQSNVSDIV